MAKEPSILVIDDVEIIAQRIYERCNYLENNSCRKYIVSKSKSETINELIEEINNNDYKFIITDRGFSEISETNGVYKIIQKKFIVDEIIFDIIQGIGKEKIKAITSIIIYTYDRSEYAIMDLRNLREEMIDVIIRKNNDETTRDIIKHKIFIIESSKVFVQPRGFNLYPDLTNENIIGSDAILRKYGDFLFYLLTDVMNNYNTNHRSNELNPYGYSRHANYHYLNFLSNLSFLIKSFPMLEKGFIGSASAFGNYLGSSDYLFDVPYKHYYKLINDYIQNPDNKLDQLFYEESDFEKPFIKNQWTCYSFVRTDEQKFVLTGIESSFYESMENKLDRDRISQLLSDWFPLLYTSVFWCEESAWKLKPDISKKMNQAEYQHLFWFVTDLTTDAFKGSINFTYFVEHNRVDITKIINAISEFITPILRTNALELILSKLHDTVLFHATRAAISQVMARNMSHNVGSHVLSHYKNYPVDLKELINEEEVDCFFSNTRPNKKFSVNKQYKAVGLGLSNNGKYNLENILYFNDYLKSRMDFLADIATTDPSMENPMYFVREVMNGIDKNRILLDRISGIDGIEFDFNVRLFSEKENEWKQINGSEADNDPIVSISNDILGCQAFYIILENIIRNVAKHSKENFKEVTIFIDIRDYENNEDLFEVSIYDSLMKNKETIDELVVKRNETFNTSVLDQNNQVRAGNLGTIEMETCAAYLRMLPLASIEDRFYDINEDKYNIREDDDVKIPVLIYAYTHKHENQGASEKNYSLGYKLFLRKPQTLLIVDDANSLNQSDEAKRKLRKHGIWCVGSESLVSANCQFNHQFLLWLNKELDEKFISEKHGRLPKRILTNKDIDNVCLITKDPQAFLHKCWVTYVNKILNREKYKQVKFCIGVREIIYENVKFTNCDTASVLIGNHGTNWNNRNNHNYFELNCSHHRLEIAKLMNDELVEYRAEYIETIFTKVLIIDERIQKNIVFSFKKYNDDILYYDLFANQHIIIPTKDEANLNESSFGTLSEDIYCEPKSVADKIRNFIVGKIDIADFCIIHLGILEKMVGLNIDKDKVVINEIIEKIFGKEKEVRKKIIITSGRGKPHNIPEDLSFLSIAAIQNAIETLYDKYLLVKLLYNSRKTI